MAPHRHIMALLAGLDVGILGLTTPTARRLPAQLRHGDQWLTQAGPDHAALALALTALWLVAVWLAVALVSALVAAAPGGLGRAGQALIRRIMPRALRIAVLGSVGLAVAATPGIAHARSSGATAGVNSVVRSVADVKVAWPQSDASDKAAPPAPHVGWPNTPASPPPKAKPSTPAPARSLPASASHGGSSVTVAPGDSLWLIAAHRLGSGATQAQIAHAWPQWYAANRKVVGRNPDHIEPGEHLAAPQNSAADQKGTSK